MIQAITDEIRRYILANHLPGEAPDRLRNDARLVSSGVLDSLAILGLAAHLEATFGVELSAGDTLPDSFDRIDEMAAVVSRRATTGPTEQTPSSAVAEA